MAVLVAFPNRVGSAAYSGGFWSSTLPITNLATRQLSRVARTLGTDRRTTYGYVDAGASIECAVAALAGHNLSSAGQWRLRGFAADPRPAIDLSFLLGTVPAGVTCSRASSATYWGSDGLLKTAGNNVVRLQWDVTAGKWAGLLVEPSATNAILYCRDATQAQWTKSTMTTALSATGIDGAANSATRLTASGANARVTISHALGGTYTWSVWLRRVTGSGTVRMSADNWATTTVVTLTTAWVRYSVTSSSASSAVGIQIDTVNDVIEMDYGQVEAGSVATMPILTASATASRTAETVTYVDPSAAGIDWTDGSMVIDAIINRLSSSSTPLVVLTPGGNSAGFYCNTTSQTAELKSGTALQAQISGPAIAAGSDVVAAMSWAVNDVRASWSGGAVGSDSSATMPVGTPTSLQFGEASSVCAAMTIRRVRLYQSPMANADLIALSGSEWERVASYDSGAISAWPSAWLAALSAEQRTGARYPSPIILSAVSSARYWRIDLIDEANTAGYLEAGRLFIGGRLSMALNAVYGATLGYRERSLSIEVDSGAKQWIDRPEPRKVAFQWPVATDSEAVLGHLVMQRMVGTTKEVLIMWDAGDTLLAPERSFLATLQTLSPVRAVGYGIHEAAIEAEELL